MILIYDHGLFIDVADKLAESNDTYYYAPVMEDQFPVARRALVGCGRDNLTRVYRFFDYIADADTIVFPDVGLADLQNFLRQCGKQVWGSASAEFLELDRGNLKRFMAQAGMETGKYETLMGMPRLRTLMEQEDERWIKVSRFRGDLETFHHRNWFLTQPWFDALETKIGPMSEILEFVVEQTIEGIEVGYDGFTVDGAFPDLALIGYEAKDAAYVGKVVSRREMPPCLTEANAQLSPMLRTLNARCAMSTELRVKAGRGILIDPCMRFGSPPGETMLEMFSNWSDIIKGGAAGQLVQPIPTGKFGAQLMLTCPWAEENFLALKIPESVRRWVKLYNHARADDVDYVMPGMGHVGAAVGIGNTLEEAKEQAREVARAIEAHELTYDEHAFDKLDETIEKGVKEGIAW